MRPWLWLVLLAALVVACSGKDQQAGSVPPSGTPPASAVAATAPTVSGTTAPPPASPAARSVPRFERGRCPMTPAAGSGSVREVICGAVAVPEDHDRPDGPALRLAVALFKSSTARSDAAPLVWLDGGPGGASLDGIGTAIAGALARALLADHDLIVFDQRGVGFSQPSLACPETVEATYEAFGKRLNPTEETELEVKARLACHDRLRAQGINLAAYTSAQNAADVNDIRAALGYRQVALYGVSYGTRLALTIMRDFPGILTSVVLDSVVPVQANLYTEVVASAQRAFDLLFDGCAADAACNAAYPNLATLFYETIARLDADPPTVQLRDPRTGVNRDLVLTGERFAGAIFKALYPTRLIPTLPRAIAGARTGNYEPFAVAVRDLLLDDSVSWGVYYSVQCGEEVRFVTPDAVVEAGRAFRREVAGLFEAGALFATCAVWGAKEAPPLENMPVTSDVPTLVLSGQYDPVTPPAWARLAAQTLTRSTVVEFPGVGHWTLAGGVCPLDVLAAFLKDPTRPPDARCIERMTAPRWAISGR
jgi:pimeloyl-ACP methyl ester carboxylesterase